MIEISVTNIIAESDKSILERIGQFIKETRVSQNKNQQQLADDAGIARSTLTLIESGAGGTLLSLIQVLRILDQLSLLTVFQGSMQVSPLLLAKQAKNKRQRASQQTAKNNPSTSWQ